MEKDKAELAMNTLIEIQGCKKNIEKFNNTKEFCKIHIRGENGAEKEFSYNIESENQKELVNIIREAALKYLEAKLKTSEDKLSNL